MYTCMYMYMYYMLYVHVYMHILVCYSYSDIHCIAVYYYECIVLMSSITGSVAHMQPPYTCSLTGRKHMFSDWSIC